MHFWQESSYRSSLAVSSQMELSNSDSPSPVSFYSASIQAVSPCLALPTTRASILTLSSSSETRPFSFRTSCRSTSFSHSSHYFCCRAIASRSSKIRRARSSFSLLHSSTCPRWVSHLRARSASAVLMSSWMPCCLPISRAMESNYLSRSRIFSSYLVFTSARCYLSRTSPLSCSSMRHPFSCSSCLMLSSSAICRLFSAFSFYLAAFSWRRSAIAASLLCSTSFSSPC